MRGQQRFLGQCVDIISHDAMATTSRQIINKSQIAIDGTARPSSIRQRLGLSKTPCRSSGKKRDGRQCTQPSQSPSAEAEVSRFEGKKKKKTISAEARCGNPNDRPLISILRSSVFVHPLSNSALSSVKLISLGRTNRNS